MKKLLSIILAVAMAISCCLIGTSAPAANNKELSGTCSVSATDYKQAPTITMNGLTKKKTQKIKTGENLSFYFKSGNNVHGFRTNGGILKSITIDNKKYKYVFIKNTEVMESKCGSTKYQASNRGKWNAGIYPDGVYMRGTYFSQNNMPNISTGDFDLCASNTGAKKTIKISTPKKTTNKKNKATFYEIDKNKIKIDPRTRTGYIYNAKLGGRKFKTVGVEVNVYSNDDNCNSFKNRKCKIVQMKINGRWQAYGIVCFKQGSDVYQFLIDAHN